MTLKFLAVDKYKDILEVFQLKYPRCFAEKAMPLKKGILDGREVEGLSKTQIRAFCQMYTSTKEYVEAHIPGAIRIDLEGNPAGVVTEEEYEMKKNTKVVSIIQRIFERGKNPPKKKFKKPQKKDADQDQKKDTTPEIKKPISSKTLSIGWKKKEDSDVQYEQEIEKHTEYYLNAKNDEKLTKQIVAAAKNHKSLKNIE